jgi:hypothetical protein
MIRYKPNENCIKLEMIPNGELFNVSGYAFTSRFPTFQSDNYLFAIYSKALAKF